MGGILALACCHWLLPSLLVIARRQAIVGGYLFVLDLWLIVIVHCSALVQRSNFLETLLTGECGGMTCRKLQNHTSF